VTRRQVIAIDKSYKCPICPHQFYTLRDKAQHLAMSWDDAHAEWRGLHSPPKSYMTMTEVMRIRQKIEEILNK
jgi:hypothetical protein